MTFFVALLACSLGSLAIEPLAADAEEIRFQGILGNSGEQGTTVVRFGDKPASGIGVIVDRYGSLWDRAGAGALNRYAMDGRLLASYRIPGEGGNRNNDAIALLGDVVILRLGQGLYTLSVDAPSGAEAKSLKIEADLMSLTVWDGWVIASKGSELFLVNAAGEKKPVATLKKAPEYGLVFGPEGSVHIMRDGKLYRVSKDAPDGQVLVGQVPGERAQFLNGFWYGSAWSSTIRRFDADLQPAPGVAFGGNSGSFIGHVAEQSEVVNGRGLARATSDLFAVSGLNGILHLLEWKPADKRFEPIRRIGAVSSCDALGLDREGRIWIRSGNWNWDDGPATPLRYGIPEPEAMYGIAMQDSDAVAGYGTMWGKPSVMFGGMDKEVRIWRIEAKTTLPKEAVAVAVSEYEKKRVLLVLEKKGKLTAVYLGGDGAYQSDAGPVRLITTTPVKEWTALASAGRDKLLGAGDGYVIELMRDGEAWKESKRWNSWGTAPREKLGEKIFLSVDAGRLWIADSSRHRIVCLSLDKNEWLAEYGEVDKPGNDLAHLDSPRVLASRERRTVVFDSGNQRLVKLKLSK